MQDAQSPSLKHGSPDANDPGVHGALVVPPLELELPPPLDPHMHAPVIVAIVPHAAGQLTLRHAAAAEPTGSRGPQFAGWAQKASVFPPNLQLTQHRQLRSLEHAWYCAQQEVLAQVTQASSPSVETQEGMSCGR